MVATAPAYRISAVDGEHPFGQAGDLPIQRFGLPVRNVVAGLSSKEFWAPGSTLRVRFDPQHPIAFGMPRDGYALFLAGSAVSSLIWAGVFLAPGYGITFLL